MRKTWNIEKEFEVRFDDLKLRHRTNLKALWKLESLRSTIDDARSLIG